MDGSRHRRRWLMLALLLALGLGRPVQAQTIYPPPGIYDCSLIPSSTFVGTFTLISGAEYVTSGGSSGRYRYDPSTQTVRWLSGPFATARWVGVFMPAEPGGKGHTATIVLKPERDPRSPGAEGPEQFLYCTRRRD